MPNIHTVTYTVKNANSIIAKDINNPQLNQTFSKGEVMEFQISYTPNFFYIEHIYSFSDCNTILLVGLLWNSNQWEKEKELYLNNEENWKQLSFGPIQLPENAKNELNKILYSQNINYRQLPYQPYYNPLQESPDKSQEDMFKEFKTSVYQSKLPLQIKLQGCNITYYKDDYINIQTTRQIEKFKIVEFTVKDEYIILSGYFDGKSWKNEKETLFIYKKNNKGIIQNKSGTEIGTIVPDKIKCIETNKLIYNGKSSEKNELVYIKEACKSMQNSELAKKIQNAKEHDLLYNFLLKLDNECIHIIPYTEEGNKTIELYKKAEALKVGPKIIDYYYVVDYYTKTATKQYLITEYLKPVTINYDDKKVKELATTIAKSNIKIHPSFIFNRLGTDKSDNLKVLIWNVLNLYPYIEKQSKIMHNYESRRDHMISRFRPQGGKTKKTKLKIILKTRRRSRN
jgi:hypothetical protein